MSTQHKTKPKFVVLVMGLMALMATIGCASYQLKIQDSYNMLRNGQPQQAMQKLKVLADEPGNDQLVYLLEYGVAAQQAQDYIESNIAFIRADRIADIKDYHSLSKVGASLLLNEGQVQYKGEDFEKVMINAYLAINFAVIDKHEDAIVECRRLNEKLTKFRVDAKREYEQNPFARYLSAMLWEADRNWDSAYIDYAEAFRLHPNTELLRDDLLFAAKKAQREDEFKRWQQTFGLKSYNPARDVKENGELIVIYQQGQGPIKKPNPESHRLPKLFPRYSAGQKAEVSVWEATPTNTQPVTGRPPLESTVASPIFSVQDVAIQTLNDLYGGMVAKRMAGIATKAVVADQIRQKNKALGDIAWIAMNLTDQADLRQWSTLPQSFQIGRRILKAGNYVVKVKALTMAGAPTGEEMPERMIRIQPGKKTFITWRSFR